MSASESRDVIIDVEGDNDEFRPISPILFSTPESQFPPTQNLLNQLLTLRSVDGIDAISLKREIDELRSKNAALMLQHEEDQLEIARLRRLSSQSQQPQNPENPADAFQPYLTKKLKKNKKIENKNEKTLPPGCTSLPASPTPTPTPAQHTPN